MIAPVGKRFGEYRIGAEPLAEKQVALFAARQAAVRAVMHQDRKTELTRTDENNRNDVGQRIGEQRDQRDRAEDHRPGMSDERDALPLDPLAQERKLLLRDQLTGRNAQGSGRSHKDRPRSLPSIARGAK